MLRGPAILWARWQVWGPDAPDSNTAARTLHNELKFTEDAARRSYKVYRETIEFLKGEGALPPWPTADATKAPSQGSDGDERDDRSGPMPVGAQPESRPKPAWEERIVDEKGVAIVIRFDQEPTPASLEYARDYLNFKIRRMTASAERAREPRPSETDG